jgi:hypothetical protein
MEIILSLGHFMRGTRSILFCTVWLLLVKTSPDGSWSSKVGTGYIHDPEYQVGVFQLRLLVHGFTQLGCWCTPVYR